MGWQKLIFEISPDRRALLEQRALELGALSISLEDAGDEPLLEPAPGETPLWSRVRFIALFPGDVSRSVVSRALDCSEATWEQLDDRDWEHSWREEFTPACFGDRLWICPTADATPGKGSVVRLDPGLAFGTGRHATTALCLDWLAGAGLDGCTVLDYGCGSGVLGLAAAALGASKIYAVDIDEQALIATRNNAAANGWRERFHLCQPEDRPPVTVDLVLANILAGPLVTLAPRFAVATRTGGAVVLSGILAEQADPVQEAYAPWFEIGEKTERAGWVRLSGTRNDSVYTMS